jgi:cytochrome b561
MSKILLALFVMHVGAAIYHQVIRRDHLLARMGVGRA